VIISHEHKFIYFKSCKTAGTSIEVFLSAYCGAKDTITHIGEPTAEWHVARNPKKFRKHDSALNVYLLLRDNLGHDKFNEYYKFTSVRNPLDKMQSLFYFWKHKRNSLVRNEDFNQFIARYDFAHLRPVFHAPYYKIWNKIITDDLIRYESLSADLKRLCGIFGFDYDDKYLLHYKKHERDDIVITEQTKDIIRGKFKQELIDLNYTI